eukprot:COSAG01_NODE_2292_length_7969_cov_3.362262_3_plen_51_part_00
MRVSAPPFPVPDRPTIPQLYIDGEFVGGCDIVRGMYEDGSLTEALADYKA